MGNSAMMRPRVSIHFQWVFGMKLIGGGEVGGGGINKALGRVQSTLAGIQEKLSQHWKTFRHSRMASERLSN